jgi:ferric-dicitrate binding protein FerR (iron transport regulator)/TolA-binding protein
MSHSDQASAREQAASALGRIGRVLDSGADTRQDQLGKERFLVAIAERPRFRHRRGLAVAMAAAALLCGVLALWLGRKPAPLEYQVMGSLTAQGDWLGVLPDRGSAQLRFSEGTELELGPGSKGRVAEVTADGARFELGAGRLHARVVHRPKSRWVVAAGPYAIEVTGTAFDVRWSESGERLEVKLHDGSVIVRGPSLHDGIRLGAGQRLVAHGPSGKAELSSLFAPEAAAEKSTAEPALGPAAPAEPAAPPAAGGSAPEPSAPRAPSWSELVAAGKFRGVLDAARARGVDQTLASGSLTDLAALSDAARYAGEPGLARRGLLAQRKRFPSSAEARAAAFILGRMADDGGSPSEALGWYDRYLAEKPGGSFAAEASGRRLVALVRLGRTDAAREAAESYVKRYPRGAHAKYARELLGNR